MSTLVMVFLKMVAPNCLASLELFALSHITITKLESSLAYKSFKRD